jgi:hypothetical protein
VFTRFVEGYAASKRDAFLPWNQKLAAANG